MRLAIAKPSYSPRPTPITLTSAFGFFGAALAWHVVSALVISLWYSGDLPFFRDELLTSLEWFWRWDKPWQILLFNLHAAGGVIGLEFLIGYVVWRISRAWVSEGIALRDFVLCWWRGCLLCTLIGPVALLTTAWLAGISTIGWIPAVLVLTIAPAGLAPRILRTPQRWRPVCPECGQSVAFAAKPRCSECGDPYPCSDRFYRRWGIVRLPWDQKRRSLVAAYVKTVFFILFRPATAAWRLANPDRVGRAVRWTLGHALAVPVISGAIVRVANGWFSGTLSTTSLNDQFRAAGVQPADITAEFSWIWWMESATVDALAPLLPALLGIGIVLAAPRLQPAARLGLMKWTLYLSILPIALGAAFSSRIWVIVLMRMMGGRSMMSVTQLPAEYGAAAILGLHMIYAIWWAVGVAAQPYLRHRGLPVFLSAFFTYMLIVGSIANFVPLREIWVAL